MIDTPAYGLPLVRWTHLAHERIIRLAHDRAGLTFPENRRELAESAISRAMAHVGQSDLNVFADRVAVEERYYNAVLTELTVGETYFFRDPSQWELLRTIVIPEILRTHANTRGVHAWSAGCASGEEAYTLAITLREAGCSSPTVVGTDLCDFRLGRAARGVYTKWSMRGMDDSKRSRYFRESGQHFHLLPEYRDVRFRPLNLAGNGYGASGQELFGLDLILCRNVLIYIDEQMVSTIFERLVASLAEGGWLMIAASDPQPSHDLPLDVVVTESGLLFRKNSAANRNAYPIDGANAERIGPSDVPRERLVPQPRIAPPAKRPASAPTYKSKSVPVASRPTGAATDGTVTLIQQARALANRGEIAASLASVNAALAAHDDVAELYVLHSILNAELGNFAAAADAARRALYLDRTLVVAQVALSTALVRGNDIPAASRALRAAERSLSALAPSESVRGGDGATVASLLNIVRAHRTLLEQRSANAH